MTEIQIGQAKRARRAYSFDDIAIVPSRRTRDPEEVSTHWQIDAYRFDLPVIAAPMDSVMSPTTAIAMGRFGGLGVLNLEGLWTRYEDPEPLLEEVAGLTGTEATRRMQEIYDELKIPDERLRSGRSTGKYTSLQVAADQGKTQRSRATPNSSATSAAMRMKAAAMSTDMMLLSSLG